MARKLCAIARGPVVTHRLDPRDGFRLDLADLDAAANFALLELDRPAAPVAAALLARHGIYVRDCADTGGRFLRVAARPEGDNRRVVAALGGVLGSPVSRAA